MTTKKESEADVTIPEVLGKGWAHVQHGMDKAIGWGIKRMREAGEAEAKPAEGKVGKVGRGVLKFFGQLGDAYYETYEDLKRKKR
jgi:hypothetical protein